MGASGGASTGGGGGGVGPAGVKVSKKGKKTYGTKKDAKKTSSRNEFSTFVKEGGVIGAVAKPFLDATKEVNTKFYNEKVVPAGKSKAPNYETYMKDRLAGKTDAYGNPTPKQGGGNNNTPTVKVASIPKVTTAPTEAEVDLSSATDTTAVEEPKKVDDIYTRKRKTKARGRSMMTLTGPRGLSKDEKLTLGRPSLLGS
jgi:hypothetical protein